MTQCGACLLHMPDNLSLDSQNPHKSQPAIKHMNTHVHIYKHTCTHMYMHIRFTIIKERVLATW